MKFIAALFLSLWSVLCLADCTAIISATTSPTTSSIFTLNNLSKLNPNQHATLVMHAASGLSASEHADVQVCPSGATATCADAFEGSTQVRLNANNNLTTITGSGHYRVVMDSQTNAASVWVCVASARRD